MSKRSSLIAEVDRRYRRIRLTVPGLMLPAVAAGLFIGGQSSAHHSFAATYIESERITIEGTVLQFQFRNPHSFIHVQAPDENGEMHRWAVEWSSPATLSDRGVNQGTLRPGDVVRVTGAPGRDPSDHRMVLREISRPADGYEFKGTTD